MLPSTNTNQQCPGSSATLLLIRYCFYAVALKMFIIISFNTLMAYASPSPSRGLGDICKPTRNIFMPSLYPMASTFTHRLVFQLYAENTFLPTYNIFYFKKHVMHAHEKVRYCHLFYAR